MMGDKMKMKEAARHLIESNLPDHMHDLAVDLLYEQIDTMFRTVGAMELSYLRTIQHPENQVKK